MKNNFKKFRKIPLITSIIFLALSCIVFVFLYRKIESNNQISDQAEAQWQTESSRKDQIESLNNFLKVIENERAEINTHFVQSSDVVPFLDTVEKLAPEAGAQAEVTLVDISPDKKSLNVGVNVDGSFESIYKFLLLLENSPYQLEFSSMDMQKIDSGPASAAASKWTAFFKIKLLSFLQ